MILDVIPPVIAAAVFVLLTSLIREPTRLRVHALLVAGAACVYLNGGLGAWEILFAVAGLAVAYRAQRSYRFVGLAWLMHAAWDVVHHAQGLELLSIVPDSSFGCGIMDALLGAWYVLFARTPR